MKSVGDWLELTYGKALKAADRDGGSVPVVGSGGVVGGHSSGLTSGPTIVVGRKGSIGSITWIDGPAWPIDTAYFVTPRRSDLDLRWAFWMLQSLGMSLMNKSAAVPGLNRDDVYRLPVDVPPIEEQRRIAAILDQADAIRTKRRQVLAHLDTLVEATFHAMFGNPVGGDWACAPLGEVVERIDSGTSPNCESRPAGTDEWGVLKLGAVTYGVFRPSENKAYLGSIGPMSVNEVHPGDVLMTRKNTRELVGAVAVVEDVRPRLLLPDLIFRLEIDRERMTPWYFQAMMMSGLLRAAVRSLSSGSAASMPNISKARLRTLTIGVPPISVQRQFDRRVTAVNAQRALIERALAADDELFASLQSRAFRGEL